MRRSGRAAHGEGPCKERTGLQPGVGGSGLRHLSSRRQASPPAPEAAQGRGARGGGRVWSAVQTEMQGREGVTDTLPCCDALLGLFLWPAQVTPAAPCFLAHCHAPAVLQPPLPQLLGRSRPRPVLFLLRLGPRGGVHGQGAKSHLPVHASLSGPSEESSPPSSRPPQLSVPQLSPAPLLRSFNASFPSPDNCLSVLRHQARDLSQLPGSLPLPEPHHLKGRWVLTVLNPEQFASLYAFSPAPGSPPRSQLHLPLLIHPSCHHEIIY